MDEFYKTISLSFEADKESMDSIKGSMKALGKLNLIDDKSSKNIVKQLDEYSKKQQVIAKLQNDIATLNKLNTKEANEAAKALQKELKLIDGGSDKNNDKTGSFKNKIVGSIAGIATNFLNKLKGLTDNALDRLKDMSKYAFMTDSSVRDLKLGYGLSSSQAYGMSQAMTTMGFSSIEDLMWADNSQLAMFRKAFDKYSKYYEDTMTPEFIEKQLEYQVEMQMFKADLEHEVIEFFMDNKDTIMKFMDFGIEAMKLIVKVFGRTIDAFSSEGRSESARLRDARSILNSYTTNNSSKSVSMTNNFTSVNNDTSMFANMSSQIYKQTIEALERG